MLKKYHAKDVYMICKYVFKWYKYFHTYDQEKVTNILINKHK
jgi:hypothetical protein